MSNLFVFVIRPDDQSLAPKLKHLVIAVLNKVPGCHAGLSLLFNEAVNITRQVLLTNDDPETFDGDLEFIHLHHFTDHCKADEDVILLIHQYQQLTAAIARLCFGEFKFLINSCAAFNSVFDIVGVNIAGGAITLWCSKLKALPGNLSR